MNSELLGAQESRIFQREVSVESAPQVEHPKEPFSDDCMQESDQSDVEMEKARLSDMDNWSDNSSLSALVQVRSWSRTVQVSSLSYLAVVQIVIRPCLHLIQSKCDQQLWSQ